MAAAGVGGNDSCRFQNQRDLPRRTAVCDSPGTARIGGRFAAERDNELSSPCSGETQCWRGLRPQCHFRYLQQHDHCHHRNDEHDHCHGQPDAPVFLASGMLSCLKFLISCGSLCVPSDLLLLSGFPALRHVLPLFPVRCDALHNEGLCKPPHMLSQRMS